MYFHKLPKSLSLSRMLSLLLILSMEGCKGCRQDTNNDIPTTNKLALEVSKSTIQDEEQVEVKIKATGGKVDLADYKLRFMIIQQKGGSDSKFAYIDHENKSVEEVSVNKPLPEFQGQTQKLQGGTDIIVNMGIKSSADVVKFSIELILIKADGTEENCGSTELTWTKTPTTDPGKQLLEITLALDNITDANNQYGTITFTNTTNEPILTSNMEDLELVYQTADADGVEIKYSNSLTSGLAYSIHRASLSTVLGMSRGESLKASETKAITVSLYRKSNTAKKIKQLKVSKKGEPQKVVSVFTAIDWPATPKPIITLQADFSVYDKDAKKMKLTISMEGYEGATLQESDLKQATIHYQVTKAGTTTELASHVIQFEGIFGQYNEREKKDVKGATLSELLSTGYNLKSGAKELLKELFFKDFTEAATITFTIKGLPPSVTPPEPLVITKKVKV